MYIEYHSPQLVTNRLHPSIWTKPTRAGGAYRPSWLIRTSDWQKVPGTDAKNGYCALSYCWEQSGEIITAENGDSICVDEPRHQITYQMVFPPLMWFTGKPKALATRKVTFEGVLQQICKDHKIDYLWYDKVCIDQTNKKEKRREVKQMHLIYSSARFTVVFIPEFAITTFQSTFPSLPAARTSPAETMCFDRIRSSLWFTRSWTLEELMMSTDILVIGKNAYKWHLRTRDDTTIFLKQCDYFTIHMLGYKDQEVKSASQVLHYAHSRTSSKEHDKIFALANILSDVVSIDIDYDIDIATLVHTFYRRLIERDLSIMCFGTRSVSNGIETQLILPSTFSSYGLPSWAGAGGLHFPYPVADIALDQDHPYFIDNNSRLHITCRFYRIRLKRYDGPLYYHFDDKRKERAGDNNFESITSIEGFDDDKARSFQDWIQRRMFYFTGVYATHYWKTDQPAFTSPILPLSLTEDCEECIIPAMLFDVTTFTRYNSDLLAFRISIGLYHAYVAPVLKKSTGSQLYKVVGSILLKTYSRKETPEHPHGFLDRLFTPLCADRKEFIVE